LNCGTRFSKEIKRSRDEAKEKENIVKSIIFSTRYRKIHTKKN
jgi:hypothetical protein